MPGRSPRWALTAAILTLAAFQVRCNPRIESQPLVPWPAAEVPLAEDDLRWISNSPNLLAGTAGREALRIGEPVLLRSIERPTVDPGWSLPPDGTLVEVRPLRVVPLARPVAPTAGRRADRLVSQGKDAVHFETSFAAPEQPTVEVGLVLECTGVDWRLAAAAVAVDNTLLGIELMALSAADDGEHLDLAFRIELVGAARLEAVIPPLSLHRSRTYEPARIRTLERFRLRRDFLPRSPWVAPSWTGDMLRESGALMLCRQPKHPFDGTPPSLRRIPELKADRRVLGERWSGRLHDNPAWRVVDDGALLVTLPPTARCTRATAPHSS